MTHKYEPLADYLRCQSGPCHDMSFEAIETVIGSNLPPSTFAHRAWWANHRSHPEAKDGWLAAGWLVDSVNLTRKTVAFRR